MPPCGGKPRNKGLWLLIGSLALKTDDPDGRFANRSFLIDPEGQIVARYDKIHMFDVQIDAQETYRESAGYRPGTQAVVARHRLRDHRHDCLLRHALSDAAHASGPDRRGDPDRPPPPFRR